MTNTLAVTVNRTDLHSLEVPETFEASGPFTVELRNHGEATHVHLHLDDTLSTVAQLDAVNHYVDAGETRDLTVDVRDPDEWPQESIRGHLKVVTGHGQQTRYVEVLLERSPADEPVKVDPELAEPRPRETAEANPILRAVPVAVLGGVALILAVGTLFAGSGISFILGGFALLAGAACAVAAYYLLS